MTSLVRQCKRPNDPANGNVVSKTNNQQLFDAGQKVWFNCDRGFKLDGKKDFVCQKDGSWEPQPFPRCVPDGELFVILLQNTNWSKKCIDTKPLPNINLLIVQNFQVQFELTLHSHNMNCLYFSPHVFSEKSLRNTREKV